jgi:hypothetical protein
MRALARVSAAGPAIHASLFLLLVLPMAVFMAVVVPLGQVADEPAQIGRAASLLHWQIIGHREDVALADGAHMRLGGVNADLGAMTAANVTATHHPPHVGRALIDQQRAVPWNNRRDFIWLGPIGSYWPAFYVPAAAAMGAAQRLGALPYRAIYAGRLANALAYALMGAAAVGLARRAAPLFAATLAMPMAVSLGASFNQDGLMIAATVLAASLLTGGPDDGRLGARYAAGAFLLANVVMAKPPYAPLALMLLAPVASFARRPASWDRAARIRAAAFVLVVALAVGWAAIGIAYVNSPIPRPPHPPGPLWPGDPARVFDATDIGAQLRVLLANPLRLLTLPFGTMLTDPWLLRETVGVLGWLDVVLPQWLYAAWYVALGAALLAGMVRARTDIVAASEPSRWDAVAMVGAALVCLLGIYLSQYLVWTDVGAQRIEGPQGRYLLPLLPLLSFGLPRIPLPASLAAVWSGALGVAPLALAAIDLAALPTIVVSAYYVT